MTERHPSLLFDGYLSFEADAEALRAQPLYSESEVDAESTQHGKYSLPGDQITLFANTLGALGGDENLQKLREALLHYAHYRKWIGASLAQNNPPWHSELNSARFLYGLALGYDCAYPVLTAEERREIARAADEKGIAPVMRDWLLPGTRIHSLDSMGHNWWPVCIAAAGLASIAFEQELPALHENIALVDEGLRGFFAYRGSALFNKPVNFDENGGCTEGINYLNYGLGEILLYRLARDRAYGRRREPYDHTIVKALDYMAQSLYGDLCTPNAGDCGNHVNYSRTLALAMLCGFDKPWMRWYIRRRPLEPAFFGRLISTEGGKPPILRPVSVWRGAGKAVLRAGKNYLHVTCGSTWNHTHADAGGFQLYQGGEAVLTDGGSCSYASDQYPLYYCQSKAHNVLLCGGHGQEFGDHYYGAKTEGRILDAAAGRDIRYLLCDAQGPMARWFSRHNRSFLLFGDALLIYDDVRAYAPCALKTLWHGPLLAVQKGTLTAGGARVLPLYPAGGRWETFEGHADHQPGIVETAFARVCAVKPHAVAALAVGDPNRLAAGEETCEQKLVNAVLLSQQADATLCERKDALHIVLKSGKKTLEVVCNLNADGRKMHANSHLTLDNVQTDAYLYARADGELLLAQCSYFRQNGVSVHESLEKKTILVKNAEG